MAFFCGEKVKKRDVKVKLDVALAIRRAAGSWNVNRRGWLEVNCKWGNLRRRTLR